MKPIEAIMKELKVEYGESFWAEFSSKRKCFLKFDKDMLLQYDEERNEWVISSLLDEFLFNDITITKDFQPQMGESYFYIVDTSPTKETVIESKTFNFDVFDSMCLAVGNCFKTEEEALSTVSIVKVNKKIYRALHL